METRRERIGRMPMKTYADGRRSNVGCCRKRGSKTVYGDRFGDTKKWIGYENAEGLKEEIGCVPMEPMDGACRGLEEYESRDGLGTKRTLVVQLTEEQSMSLSIRVAKEGSVRAYRIAEQQKNKKDL